MSDEEIEALEMELLGRCLDRWKEVPAEERAVRERCSALLLRIKRRTEILVLTEWHKYVKEARAAMLRAVHRWNLADVRFAWDAWLESAAQRRENALTTIECTQLADWFHYRLLIYDAFLCWAEMYVAALKTTADHDREAIEAALVAAELQLVYDAKLASYPLPNSCADCDGGCSRKNLFRFYHVDFGLPGGGGGGGGGGAGGMDLCEMCFACGEYAESMSDELRASFTLVVPQLVVAEGWRDVAAREQLAASLTLQAASEHAARQAASQGAMRQLQWHPNQPSRYPLVAMPERGAAGSVGGAFTPVNPTAAGRMHSAAPRYPMAAQPPWGWAAQQGSVGQRRMELTNSVAAIKARLQQLAAAGHAERVMAGARGDGTVGHQLEPLEQPAAPATGGGQRRYGAFAMMERARARQSESATDGRVRAVSDHTQGGA